MSYIENNLMAGENVLYQAKLHWAVFVWPVIWLITAIIFLSKGTEYAGAGGFFILGTIVTFITSLISYKTSEFGITNKRVIAKVGFIRRKSIEVLLNKIEGIQVDQGILGRILGYGSITVGGTGGTKDPFHMIDSPFEFRKKAQEQISVVQESK